MELLGIIVVFIVSLWAFIVVGLALVWQLQISNRLATVESFVMSTIMAVGGYGIYWVLFEKLSIVVN